MLKTSTAAIAALLIGAGAALANDGYSMHVEPAGYNPDMPEMTGAAGLSTLGWGGEFALRMSDRFGLRAPFGTAQFDYDQQSKGESYKGDIDMGGVGLLADYFPFEGGYHISAGVFYTDYSVEATAKNVAISGYGTTDITAKVTQDGHFAPAITFGYDGKIGERMTLNAGLGAIFGSGFTVEGSESTGTVPQGTIDTEISKITKFADDFDVMPYAKLMVGFRF